jgi:UDP-glucose 4-epimerase
MEKMCLAYARLYDFEAVCLRYFNVYGPNQRFDAYGNVIPIFVFQLLSGERPTIFGNGTQTRDFVSVSDVIQANIKAAEKEGVTGAYNLSSGTQITISDLYAKICEHAEIDTPPRFGPERPGDVMHSRADISRAKEAFGYRPLVDIDSGLAEYVDWARTEVSGVP